MLEVVDSESQAKRKRVQRVSMSQQSRLRMRMRVEIEEEEVQRGNDSEAVVESFSRQLKVLHRRLLGILCESASKVASGEVAESDDEVVDS